MDRLRFLSLIAVFFSFLGSCLAMLVGALKAFEAYRVFLIGPALPGAPDHLDRSDGALFLMVQSIDAFLIAQVFLVFAAGIYSLFVAELPRSARLDWLHVRSIEHLKKVLVEVVIVVLIVSSVGVVVYQEQALTYEVLYLPASVALLALSLRLIGWHAPVDGE